jgi:putative membrane protein insertion efficiency factor
MPKLVRLMIRAYHYMVSPFLGNHCRSYFSCSQYALAGIDRFWLLRGGGKALPRLSRRRPWHPGGFEPVPAPRNPRHDG